ncbi:MAG TPA: thiolase domain-containing protein [Anaerolineaceae bacterium]|nr:thiolase domain-containing protein [Anaerolineaceae bacterium]HPN50970.1 thiolase domain-containing protein [Anaerolineaceae bacterium]
MNSEVVIAGVGQVPVGEHYHLSLRSLAAKAMLAAIHEAGDIRPQAVFAGNMLAGTLSRQSNLGALLTDNINLRGVEGTTVEAAGASGAAALRLGYLAIASGYIDSALVVGVDKYTDSVGADVDAALAQTLDSDYELMAGLTPVAQAALVMRRYMHTYNVAHEAFAPVAVNGHARAANNPNAMFRKAITVEQYRSAEDQVSPLNLYDIAPYGDGAAAVLLIHSDKLEKKPDHPLVRITGSSVVTDTLALHDRQEMLAWYAAAFSIERACRQAGIMPQDVDFFEYDDACSIYAALSVEAAGFARRGTGCEFIAAGSLPVATMGGQKGRGNSLGGSGVYQAVEATLQLRGQAGKNQVPGAKRALIHNLGGAAATAISHVLEL